jgi:SAM-dependent methyltransferase
MLKTLVKKIIPYKVYFPIVSKYREILSKKYAGDRFFCPICKTGFSNFLEFGFDNNVIRKHNIIGAGLSPNGTCPRCLSNDRERHVFLYLKQHHEHLFSDEVDLLHIAPEKNLWEMFRKQKNINYMPAGLDMQLASVRMDITKIQENDNHFDMVICNHVLEHIVDDRLAMSELFRVLKKGGYAILQVPISFQNDDTIEDKSIVDPDERRAVFGQSDHVRIYGCDYISRLESVGFSVKAIDFISELTDEQVQKYSLIPEERIFVCRK